MRTGLSLPQYSEATSASSSPPPASPPDASSLASHFGGGDEEVKALGVPYNERGDIIDEYLKAIYTLWTQNTAFYGGYYFDFPDVILALKPVRTEGVRTSIGGNSPAAQRHSVRGSLKSVRALASGHPRSDQPHGKGPRRGRSRIPTCHRPTPRLRLDLSHRPPLATGIA